MPPVSYYYKKCVHLSFDTLTIYKFKCSDEIVKHNICLFACV